MVFENEIEFGTSQYQDSQHWDKKQTNQFVQLNDQQIF